MQAKSSDVFVTNVLKVLVKSRGKEDNYNVYLFINKGIL